MKKILSFFAICMSFLLFSQGKGEVNTIIDAPVVERTGLDNDNNIRFENVTASAGLTPYLQDWQLAHAASWGDLNGDGWPELYIGAFCDRPRWTDGPLSNMLFINKNGSFTLDGQTGLQYEQLYARTSQVLLADLDQDGDLDMIVACHTNKPNEVSARLWRNDGNGAMEDVTPRDGYWPHPMGYRNIAVVDLNDDGWLDFVACDNNYSNWRDGKGTLMVMINQHDMTFKDGREQYGFPAEGTNGFGLAVGDVNNDGRLDFFVAECNRLFVSMPDGRYREVQPGFFLKPQQTNPQSTNESRTCGAVFGDVNGDGLLDLLTSEHGANAQPRLYLNTGIRDGVPEFRNVTEEAGLLGPIPPRGMTGLDVKSGNVALIDLDNDGHLDIWVSVIWQDEEGKLQPVVYRNQGTNVDGVPQFSRPPLERVIGYYAAAPLADYDRDGRVDCFMAAWFHWDETPSTLFRNVSSNGNWLAVRVKGGGSRNTMGIGAVVYAYPAGKAGEAQDLIQRRDIVVGAGYSSGEEGLAHLGLGNNQTVDLVIRWGKETRTLRQVKVNQYLTVDWAQTLAQPDEAALVQDTYAAALTQEKPNPAALLAWPPKLPDGKNIVTDTSPEFILQPDRVKLEAGVEIAKTPPTIDFLYYPGQTKFTRLWSNWGEGLTVGNKYYSTIGDHNIPRGIAQVYEYDSATKTIRMLMDVKEFLEQPGMMPPDMDYTPAKIHSRIVMGSDGWLYFSTHSGATKNNTDDAHGYKGDWIFKVNPATGEKAIVAAYPVPKHTIPAGTFDPNRMIFYGGSAPGNDAADQSIQFLSYDVKNGKTLTLAPGGFARYCIFSNSTGNVYWQGTTSTADGGQQVVAAAGEFGMKGRKYDPKTNKITDCPGAPNVRAATPETKDGKVYGFTKENRNLWVFDVATETSRELGSGTVGQSHYIASMTLDPVTQRYIYYVPGAHGSGSKDGTAIVQYDIQTNKRKVVAFVGDYYQKKYGYYPEGTFSVAVSPDGATLFVTWNGARVPSDTFGETCAMMAIHIPRSERLP